MRCIFKPLAFVVLLWCSSSVWAQLVDYQQVESPIISWQYEPAVDAGAHAGAYLGLMAQPSANALYNPALAGLSRQSALTLSVASNSYNAYQYWGLNQGPFRAVDAPSEKSLLPSLLAYAMPWGKTHLQFGLGLANQQNKPDFSLSDGDENEGFIRTFEGRFDGETQRAFLAAAYPLNHRLFLGLRLEHRWGDRQVRMVQTDAEQGVYRYEEDHAWDYEMASAGLWWQGETWALSLAYEHAFTDGVDRAARTRFDSPLGTSIVSAQAYRDDLDRPSLARLELGRSLGLWQLALGVRQTHWQGYTYEHFGRHMPREMRDTQVWHFAAKRAGARGDSWRVGFSRDPQPLVAPKQVLNHFHGGYSWPLRSLELGLGVSYAWGSAEAWEPQHLTLSYSLIWRRP